MHVTSVLVCDDDRATMALVEEWVRDWADIEITGTAADMRQAVERAARLTPDVVVTDSFVAFGDVEYFDALRRASPASRIVLFTGYAEYMLPAGLRQVVDAMAVKDVDGATLRVALDRLLSRPADG